MAWRGISAVICGAILMLSLTGCGLNAATGRDYTPAHGANDKDGQLDVLAAVVVSAEAGKGTFVASLSNDARVALNLTGVGGLDEAAIGPADFRAIKVPAQGLVNLINEDPIVLSGDFEAGDSVELVVSFSDGDQQTLQVPVVPNEGIWESLDQSASPSE